MNRKNRIVKEQNNVIDVKSYTTTYTHHSLLQERNKGENPSLMDQRVVVYQKEDTR